ncbi:MAG: TonB-dependent receptor plug domain-containing protein, partial [Vicinamibacterales bacterium]
MRTLASVALAAAMACQLPAAHAQSETPSAPADANATVTLPPITVKASADASAQGLSPAFPGGQVARGGRAGILGTKDNLDTPFSITSYTNELIQDRQARSVGDVLQNDPGVRVARGFGNFQESYFIRGFILGSDDVAYNGLDNL